MLKNLKRFFDQQLTPSDADPEHTLRLATAALLLEVMGVDDHQHEREQQTIRNGLAKKFDLDQNEVTELVELAAAELREATDYYQFTALVNQNFEYERKVALVALLWRVAAADGDIDKYEEHLIRRVADLLYVSHKDFINTKHQALDR